MKSSIILVILTKIMGNSGSADKTWTNSILMKSK